MAILDKVQDSQIKLQGFFLCPEHGHGHLAQGSQACTEGLDKMTSRGSPGALFPRADKG